jgi:hypothetical protein
MDYASQSGVTKLKFNKSGQHLPMPLLQDFHFSEPKKTPLPQIF